MATLVLSEFCPHGKYYFSQPDFGGWKSVAALEFARHLRSEKGLVMEDAGRVGERPEVLAKVKGYEWVLVGKDGTGIGYVAISMLSPADKYIP